MIGSTWNKWDLHIHSPLTHQNNRYEGLTLEEFVTNLGEKDISLVGITNYFYFAKNELDLIRSIISEKQLSTTVLGNVEFRLNQQNKNGEWINIHAVFAEHITTEKINSVLARMPIINTGPHQQTTYCCKDSMAQNNIKLSEVTVALTTLIEHLRASFRFGVDYLLAVCPNGYGGFRPNIKEGRSLATAREIEIKGQIILGRPEDREFFLNNLDRYKGAISKPVFSCSDAHGNTSDFQNGRFAIGEKYTWVKAHPTFEGLRQSLIEPEARVQQTDDFIEKTFQKPKFTSIELGGEIFVAQTIRFKRQRLLLNPNLVAIIGGRGTGKSLFLDSMLSLFQSSSITGCVFRSIRTAIPASFGQAFRCRPDKLILTSHDFLFT